ncbi:MAG: hypothetical protein O7C39_00440 [Bacteroidetes bacterium]|nr:hypothetical protein [Bacteroidota bacterium]
MKLRIGVIPEIDESFIEVNGLFVVTEGFVNLGAAKIGRTDYIEPVGVIATQE